MAITPITNLRGPAARIIAAHATGLSSGQPASVEMSGPDQGRVFRFFVPAGLPGVNALENDSAVSAYVRSLFSETHQALDETFSRIFRPELFGAVGDGVTDDTAAFDSMIGAMTNSGVTSGRVVLSPGKTYRVDGTIRVYAPQDFHIDGNGATWLRGAGAHPLAFSTVAPSAKGYGSGGRNVSLRRIRFEGSFTGGQKAIISAHHIDGLIVEDCTWEQAIIDSHALDLAGCRGVTVRRSAFLGANQSTDNFAEAIQLDVSTYQAISDKTATPAASYDGLPTIEVTIEDCRFENVRVSSVEYPMPLPIGVHNFALNGDAGYTQDVVIRRNTFKGWTRHPSGWAYGWIHLHGARRVEISDNRFQLVIPSGVTAPAQVVINTRGVASAIASADVAAETPTPIAVTPRIARDWLIARNTFIGWEDEAGAPPAMIYFRASSADDASGDLAHESGITIADNVFSGGSAVVAFTSGDGVIRDVDRFIITGNRVNQHVGSANIVNVSGRGVIDRNTILSTLNTGRVLYVTDASVRIEGNRLTGSLETMRLIGITRSNIVRNHISATNAGIFLGRSADAPQSTENAILENTVEALGGATVANSIAVGSKATATRRWGNRVIGAPAPTDSGVSSITSTADSTV